MFSHAKIHVKVRQKKNDVVVDFRPTHLRLVLAVDQINSDFLLRDYFYTATCTKVNNQMGLSWR